MERSFRLTLLTVLLFALAVIPTLDWLEFSSGGENLLVATLVEMQADQDASWVVPTLNGQPRVRKPPLPAWIGAWTTPSEFFTDLSTAAPGEDRALAYRRLAFVLRMTPVLMAGAIVLLIFETGRTLRDARLGLAAAAVAASSLILLRQGRSLTSDIHLALWVTSANLAILKAILGGSAWRWMALAGASVGLAMLSKGPVALVQSVLPGAIFGLLARRGQIRGVHDGSGDKPLWKPLLVAVAIGALVAAPWFVYVAVTTPDVLRVWIAEVTRRGATELGRDPWWTYLSLLPLMAPWTVLLIAGLVLCWRSRGQPWGLWPIVAVIAPLLVMSLVKDKNERYLLPILAPAALAAGAAVVACMSASRRNDDDDKSEPSGPPPAWRVALTLHWAMLLAMCLGVPVAGALATMMPERQAWWGPGFAFLAAAGLGVTCLIGLRIAWHRPGALVAVTMLLMFALHAVFLHGYRHSPPGRSEMKPLADAIVASRPAAEVWYFDPSPTPKPLPQDLQIYLNRAVRVAGSESDLPPPRRDRVIVSLQRGENPPPAPAGWHGFARVPVVGKDRFWHALSGE